MAAFLTGTLTAGAPAADSLHAAAGHGGEGVDFKELLAHIHDSHELELPFLGHVHLPQFPPVEIAGISVDFSITKHVVFLWTAAVLLCILAAAAARSNRKARVPRGLGNLMALLGDLAWYKNWLLDSRQART